MGAQTISEVDHDVAIIGGGFSGIGVAISLDRAGLSDYLIVDEASGFGGTWYWNRYPGVAVDIPSFSYQFSFAKRPNWSRVYAPGEELRGYADYCARRFGLLDRVRFRTRVTAASFDECRQIWTLELDSGDELAARYVIDATGVLTQPKIPDIDGVENFAGTTIHTARWEAGQSLKDKRVAVIGTGASAVQLIPAVAPEVAHLNVFQRTPIWCLPKLDAPVPHNVRWLLGHVPGGMAAARLTSQALVELTFPIAAHYHGTLPLATMFEARARAFVRKEVNDPELQAKLTPSYAMGCKRPSFHNEYLSTFNRDNVSLVTDPIDRITADGILTQDGTEHAADVLVFATGFKVFDPGNFPKYPVTGRGGRDLERWWNENRYQAYEGVSVPGFPNYFTMFGPYGYNGSSYFNLIETQARHTVVACSGPVPSVPRRSRFGARRTSDISPRCCESAAARCFGSRAAHWPTATTLIHTATCPCGRLRRSRPCGAVATFRLLTTGSSSQVRGSSRAAWPRTRRRSSPPSVHSSAGSSTSCMNTSARSYRAYGGSQAGHAKAQRFIEGPERGGSFLGLQRTNGELHGRIAARRRPDRPMSSHVRADAQARWQGRGRRPQGKAGGWLAGRSLKSDFACGG